MWWHEPKLDWCCSPTHSSKCVEETLQYLLHTYIAHIWWRRQYACNMLLGIHHTLWSPSVSSPPFSWWYRCTVVKNLDWYWAFCWFQRCLGSSVHQNSTSFFNHICFFDDISALTSWPLMNLGVGIIAWMADCNHM